MSPETGLEVNSIQRRAVNEKAFVSSVFSVAAFSSVIFIT